MARLALVPARLWSAAAQTAAAAPPGLQGGGVTMVTAAQALTQDPRVRIARRIAAIPRAGKASRAVMTASGLTGRAGPACGRSTGRCGS